MSELTEWFAGLPVAARVAVIALGVLQLTLQVFALIDLSRRRNVLGDRKWVWALVASLGGLGGAVVYLAVGRAVPPKVLPGDEPGAGTEGARRRALDTLFGRANSRD